MKRLVVRADGSRSRSRGDRLLGGAFGLGLSRNVQECHRWLACEWEPAHLARVTPQQSDGATGRTPTRGGAASTG